MSRWCGVVVVFFLLLQRGLAQDNATDIPVATTSEQPSILRKWFNSITDFVTGRKPEDATTETPTPKLPTVGTTTDTAIFKIMEAIISVSNQSTNTINTEREAKCLPPEDSSATTVSSNSLLNNLFDLFSGVVNETLSNSTLKNLTENKLNSKFDNQILRIGKNLDYKRNWNSSSDDAILSNKSSEANSTERKSKCVPPEATTVSSVGLLGEFLQVFSGIANETLNVSFSNLTSNSNTNIEILRNGKELHNLSDFNSTLHKHSNWSTELNNDIVEFNITVPWMGNKTRFSIDKISRALFVKYFGIPENQTDDNTERFARLMSYVHSENITNNDRLNRYLSFLRSNNWTYNGYARYLYNLSDAARADRRLSDLDYPDYYIDYEYLDENETEDSNSDHSITKKSVYSNAKAEHSLHSYNKTISNVTKESWNATSFQKHHVFKNSTDDVLDHTNKAIDRNAREMESFSGHRVVGGNSTNISAEVEIIDTNSTVGVFTEAKNKTFFLDKEMEINATDHLIFLGEEKIETNNSFSLNDSENLIPKTSLFPKSNDVMQDNQNVTLLGVEKIETNESFSLNDSENVIPKSNLFPKSNDVTQENQNTTRTVAQTDVFFPNEILNNKTHLFILNESVFNISTGNDTITRRIPGDLIFNVSSNHPERGNNTDINPSVLEFNASSFNNDLEGDSMDVIEEIDIFWKTNFTDSNGNNTIDYDLTLEEGNGSLMVVTIMLEDDNKTAIQENASSPVNHNITQDDLHLIFQFIKGNLTAENSTEEPYSYNSSIGSHYDPMRPKFDLDQKINIYLKGDPTPMPPRPNINGPNIWLNQPPFVWHQPSQGYRIFLPPPLEEHFRPNFPSRQLPTLKLVCPPTSTQRCPFYIVEGMRKCYVPMDCPQSGQLCCRVGCGVECTDGILVPIPTHFY